MHLSHEPDPYRDFASVKTTTLPVRHKGSLSENNSFSSFTNARLRSGQNSLGSKRDRIPKIQRSPVRSNSNWLVIDSGLRFDAWNRKATRNDHSSSFPSSFHSRIGRIAGTSYSSYTSPKVMRVVSHQAMRDSAKNGRVDNRESNVNSLESERRSQSLNADRNKANEWIKIIDSPPPSPPQPPPLPPRPRRSRLEGSNLIRWPSDSDLFRNPVSIQGLVRE